MTDIKTPPAANNNQMTSEFIIPFIIEDSQIRGRFLRSSDEINNILSGHEYPEIVSKLLGELLVLTSMIGSMLKLNGMITVQAQGDGAVKFLTVDFNSEGHMRGYAKVDNDELPAKVDSDNQIKSLIGSGYLVITIESSGEKPYQAIVPLEGNNLSECIMEYFVRSDQLDVAIKVAVAQQKGKWTASGIILQSIAKEGGKKPLKTSEDSYEDLWLKSKILLETATQKELLDKSLLPYHLLYRLFNEDGVRVFDYKKVEAKCRCSKEKIVNFLESISKDEIDSMTKNGKISVTCQFCSKKEEFSPDEFIG